jgi:pyrroloquinoline quinone (PQQ) biosynthesis protein C
MLLDYSGLVAVQNELDEIARTEGGHIDGWGTFGNAIGNG